MQHVIPLFVSADYYHCKSYYTAFQKSIHHLTANNNFNSSFLIEVI